MAHDVEALKKLRSSADIAGEGPLGRKISLARILTALLPLLVFVYSIFASVMSWLGYESIYGRDQLWTQALLVFTGLLMSAGGLVIWAAYRDLESTNAQLSEASFKDEVTHLYNRRFFAIRLEEEIARYRRFNHPVSLVLLDLDGFKSINDRVRPRGGRRDAARRGRASPQALARHQHHLPLRRRRVRHPPRGDAQGRRPDLCRPHPSRPRPARLPPRLAPQREPRHRLPARGRGGHRRRPHPRRRRGALRLQARGQESRVDPSARFGDLRGARAPACHLGRLGRPPLVGAGRWAWRRWWARGRPSRTSAGCSS